MRTTGRPVFHVAPTFGVVPKRQMFTGQEFDGYFEDADAVWHYLLSRPSVGRKEGTCLRGAVFNEEALAPTQLNVDYLDGLVLDLDEFPNGQAYSFDEIVRRLFRHRFIIWTTYNSTPAAPRYRLVLPLARPVARRQFRALWEYVNADLGNTVGHKQYNADRLGYLPRIPSEEHRSYYSWMIHQGPYFDPYIRFGELPETPDRVIVDMGSENLFLDRSEWLPEEEAIAKARSYLKNAHVGVIPGARHHKLFEKSCQLWWDFYLSEENVRTILLELNSRFTSPKQPSEVLKEVEAGYAWTRGSASRRQTVPAGAKRARPPATTLAQLVEVAKRLRRKQHDLAGALGAMAKGEACSTTPADIVPVIRGLARLLGEQYPDGDPKQLAMLIYEGQYGLLQPYGIPLPPPETLFLLITNRQEELRTGIKHKKDAEDQQQAAIIEEVTGRRRTAPYGLDEFAEYARSFGETHESMKKRLIITYGPSFFFFCEGKYSPGIEHNVEVAARQYLTLAKPFGVDLYTATKNDGLKPRPVSELVEDYGSIALEATYSFSAKTSRYDPVNRTFIFAQTPMRQIEPFRVAEIEDYLNIIGSEDFLDWLAHVPNLDKPARLLYLWGPKDCGKSFVPKCIARLWSEIGPVTGESYFQSFNEGIGRCPVLHMDEVLPDEFRGTKGSELLRREIPETIRPLRMKFKKEAQVVGGLRWIFSANASDHIYTNATLTKDDIEAIEDRLITVHLSVAARSYLQGLGYERIARWFHDDLFARHILYLRETRHIANVDRFGPVPRASDKAVANSIRFSGAAQTVMEFIYRVVTRGAPVGDAICVGFGQKGWQLLLCRDEMVDKWMFADMNNNRTNLPSGKDLAKALEAISQGEARATIDGRDSACNLVDLSLVQDWITLRKLDGQLFFSKLSEKAQSAPKGYQ